ncbi:MAG: alpha/beta fold hydrolase [Saprospiraceae bacterium]
MNRATQLKAFGYWCRMQGLLGIARVGETALKRFVKPSPPNIRPKQVEYLDASRQSTLTFEGRSIAVYEWGDADAPYVFSSYGWAYNAGRWRHFAPQLIEAGYRFVAVDYQGHGRSEYAECDFPTMVRLLKQVLHHFGRPELLLSHSFGAGLAMSMLSEVDRSLHPKRLALLAGFSDVEYIFRQFAGALGFSESQYQSLANAVERRTGEKIESFDPARKSLELGHIEALIAHDPKEEVTAFSNAIRLAEHFPGSYLYEAHGAGHGFTERETSDAVLNWLINGTAPPAAKRLEKRLSPPHSQQVVDSDYFR